MFIAPIPTKYKLITFRSRLEARWAIYLDSMSIPWEYELEGFNINNDYFYLPDFYITNFNSASFYLEVKPTIPAPSYLVMLYKFQFLLNQPIYLITGSPSPENIFLWSINLIKSIPGENTIHRYFKRDFKLSTSKAKELKSMTKACNEKFNKTKYKRPK